MRRMVGLASIALVIFLGACGGGGGGGSSTGPAPTPPSPTVITGSVLPGPVTGATVQLYSVDGQGKTTLMQEVRTGSDGAYAFNASVHADAVVMVSANGGSLTDPIRKASATLEGKLRAVDVWTGPVRRINVTPYTETLTRSLEKAMTPDWSPTGIRKANTDAAKDLGVSSMTDFGILDLTQAQAATPKADDVTHALVNGTFLGFWHRIETTPGQLGMSAALDALNQLLYVDTDDDRLGPAYIAGTVDFVDVTALSADDKMLTKGNLLYGVNGLWTPATVAAAMPKGLSSGSGQAPMPDDQFRLVGERQGRTHFNLRGALVSYGEGDAKTNRNELYSASVAEVFADGDVGVGRWNGGVQMVTVPMGGGNSQTNPSILSTTGWTYAAARAVSQVPACGSRRLAMAGGTKLVFIPWNSGDTGPELTLTSDSALSALYLGSVQIGVDIGVKTASGDVVRLRSPGALEYPELAGYQADAENTVYLNVPVSALFPAGSTATLTVRPAGPGARKAAAQLNIRHANSTRYSAALAFVAPDTAPDAQGCAQAGSPGAGISPKPAPGSYFVFLSQGGYDLFMGVPKDQVSFGASGELASPLLGMQFSGPAYDLAGNDYVSIGRVTVTNGDAVSGTQIMRSQPYAVVQPGTAPPTSGSAQYQLVAATAVTAERGSGSAQLSPGQIDSGSVTVYFNQSPIGTVSPYYGTARFSIAGRFAGQSFGTDVDARRGFGPLDAMVYGQTLSNPGSLSGALAGPTGEYLAVLYQSGVNGVPVRAALLFKRQSP